MRKFVISLSILLIGSASALAHSGGTDSKGCHTERKTGIYHCH
ncbi:YHYH domain-containing protein [Ochrobactrum sp. SFR4]|nr:YHYH domain-containing protein [Ochrobactrum sp. SFR4]